MEIMKKILIVLTLFFIVIAVQGKEKNKRKKLTREEKKELKRQQAEEKKKVISSIIDAKQFILKANLLRGRHDQMYNVDDQINFIKINTDKIVYQFGSASLAGGNGFGGFTDTGSIKNYNVRKNEKSGSYSIRMNISTSSGSYDVSMHISSMGRVEAEIRTPITGNRITYSGWIVPLQGAAIIKGTSL